MCRKHGPRSIMCRKHGPKAPSRRPQADHSIQGARCQHVDSAGLGDNPSQPPQPPSSPSLSLDQTNIKLGHGKTLIMFSRTHQWHWHFDNLTSLKYNHPSDFVTSPSPQSQQSPCQAFQPQVRPCVHHDWRLIPRSRQHPFPYNIKELCETGERGDHRSKVRKKNLPRDSEPS